MDNEEKELDEISTIYNQVKIGNKMIDLDYPMSAWRIIKKDYGGIEGIDKQSSGNIMDFILDTLADLIYLGVVNKDETTRAEIQEEIDRNNITSITKGLMVGFKNALAGTLPTKKAGKKGNPQKAE